MDFVVYALAGVGFVASVAFVFDVLSRGIERGLRQLQQ